MFVPPGIFFNDNKKIFPLSGISKSKTIHCNENGYYSIYESDRYGFNNPDSLWDKPKINSILIGDSFVHGACVNRPFDIASNLRKKGISSLNLGISGTGPLAQYAILKEYGHLINFKNLIWFYYEGNDLVNLNTELKFETLNRYMNYKYSNNLSNEQDKIDHMMKKRMSKEFIKNKLNKKHNSLINKNSFLKFIKLTKIREKIQFKQPWDYNKEYFDMPFQEKELKQVINNIKQISNEKNFNIYFVYLPSFTRYEFEDFKNSNYQRIKQFIIDNNIKFIDIHNELFSKEKDPLSLFPFGSVKGHYNTEGYEKISNILKEHLSNDKK